MSRFLFALLIGVACGPVAAAERPNVLVLVADDLGYADVGFQGCTDIPTPELDALAAKSVRCTSGYSGHPFCSPTRAGLLTGRYQQRFGHENNPRWEPRNDTVGLPLTETPLPRLLQKAGYETGVVGKWHLGAHPVFHPSQRGFDSFYGFLGGGHAYLPAAKAASSEYEGVIEKDGKPVKETEHLTAAIGREAAAFVPRQRSKPWLLYVAFNAPHTPLQPAARDLEAVAGIADEKRRKYAGLVLGLDRAVGRILAAVRDAGQTDRTLVVFVSDNGGPVTVNGSRNTPLRGQKGEAFEGGIRVPFLVSWPGRLTPGEYARPVSTFDILPTALAAAGEELPKNLDGVDLLPHLTAAQPGDPHPRLFWRAGGGNGRLAVREGEWKWVRTDGTTHMFHLGRDIGETKNLIADEPTRSAALEKAALAWSAELIEPAWPGLNQKKKEKP